MATHFLMYDRHAHVYMSRITSESPNLAEDSNLPSSPVSQPSEEASNLVPVLPYVPYVPYVNVYSPSLNSAPKLSKKRPLKAISDKFPTDVAPNPDQYKLHPTNHLPVWPTNANDRWDPVTGHAWPCCCQRCIELPWHNTPPFVTDPSEEYDDEDYDEEYEEREDTPTKTTLRCPKGR